MSYLGRLPPDLLRKRYAQLHRKLQAVAGVRIKLEEQVEMLKAENATLRERLGEQPHADR